MSISERLTEDLKKALKTGQKDALSVIRLIKSAVKNKEIEKGGVLNDEEIYGVLMSLVRQWKDSIEQFSMGGRQDLVEKEKIELSIIQSYLPQQLTEGELEEVIKDAIKEVSASSLGDMGKIMKSVMAKVKGKADGRLVSELVKKALVAK